MYFGPRSPSGPGTLTMSLVLGNPGGGAAASGFDGGIIPFRGLQDIEVAALLFTTGGAALAAGEIVDVLIRLIPPSGVAADLTQLQGVQYTALSPAPSVGPQFFTLTKAFIAAAIAPLEVTTGWGIALICNYTPDAMGNTFDSVYAMAVVNGGGVLSPYDGR